MTTPTGDPPWVRSANYATYGGHVGKHDFQQQGVVNPLTDVSAAEFMRLTNDVAAIAAPAAFAMLSLTCNDTTPAAPTINWIAAMNGRRFTSYPGGSAPAGFPTGARSGDGRVTLTWPTLLTDSYGVQAAPYIRTAFVMCSSYRTSFTVESTRAITVAAFDGETPLEDAEMVVWVF